MIPLFIPTLSDDVPTFNNLPPSLQERAIVVRRGDCRFNQGSGAHIVRQSVLDYCRRESLPVAIILVDTIKFQHGTWEDGKKRFRTSTPEQIERAFELLIDKTQEDGVGFTTFSTPFFNDKRDLWSANKRMAYSFFINTRTTEGCRFDGGPSRMSDIKFSIECYTSGLMSYSLMSDAVVDVAKGPTEQIESTDRGVRFNEAIDYLTGRWPDYVKERDASKNKRHVQLVGTTRDITFYPSRAFRRGKTKPTEDFGGRFDSE